MSRRDPRAARAGGFTFIELIFVMVTLIMLLAAVAPRFGPSLERFKTDRVAMESAQLLRYAQTLAISRQQIVECTLDPDAEPPRITLQVDGQPVEDRLARGRAIPPEINVEMRGLAFYPDGTSRPIDPDAGKGAPAVLVTHKHEGSTYRITVDEATGRVAVFAGKGDGAAAS